MPWPIKMIDSIRTLFDAQERNECTIGWAWWAENSVTKERMICICMPNNNVFCPTGNNQGHNWQVTGEWPNATCTPSIACDQSTGGTYHGWIQNGIITDDCEGRKYDSAGLLVKKE